MPIYVVEITWVWRIKDDGLLTELVNSELCSLSLLNILPFLIPLLLAFAMEMHFIVVIPGVYYDCKCFHGLGV